MAKSKKHELTLGEVADALYDLREERHDLQKEIEKIEVAERELKNRLIAELDKGDLQGVLGKKARAAVHVRPTPTVKDWAAFGAYILKQKDLSLLQRRPSEAAVKERWEAGEVVPGVDRFNVVTVSVTKITK